MPAPSRLLTAVALLVMPGVAIELPRGFCSGASGVQRSGQSGDPGADDDNVCGRSRRGGRRLIRPEPETYQASENGDCRDWFHSDWLHVS